MSPANFTIPNHLHRFITQTDVWNLYLTSMKITDTSCKKKIIIISTLAPFLPTFTIPGVTSLATLTTRKENKK